MQLRVPIFSLTIEFASSYSQTRLTRAPRPSATQSIAFRSVMIVVFGSSNAFGHDVSEAEMLLLAATVFVVSVLVALVYKLARGWEEKDGLLPLPARATTRWVKSRKHHYGKLGTIQEHEVFVIETKRR